jgi:hypothetical protein
LSDSIVRADCRRRRWSRRDKIGGDRAFARTKIDQIAAASACGDRIVIAFAVEEIVAALAEELIAAAGRLRSVGAKIAIDVIDGVVLASIR